MEDIDVPKINTRCIEVCCATYLVSIETMSRKVVGVLGVLKWFEFRN